MKMLSLLVTLCAALSVVAADPNPFADYGKAMASDKKSPMAVEWHNANAKAIDEATTPEVLSELVATEAAADKLLEGVCGAYATDPLLMTQIAAVTQWVMMPDPCFIFFWKPVPSEGRKIWVAALKKKIASTGDDYIKTFCRQQLDLCE